MIVHALTLIALLAAGAAQAAPAPAWVDNPPQSDRRFVYAVGEGQAKTRNDAEKRAVEDAVRKLARQVETTVTGRTIATLSGKGSETFTEHRESVRTVLQGVEPVGELYVKVVKKGFPPFRRKSFEVKVLMKLPRTSMEGERQRSKTAWKRYRASLSALAKDLRRTLRLLRLTSSVAVGGFTEATSGRAYTMSTMLKKDLGDALVRAGIKLKAPSRARTIVTGSYRVHGGDIVVTARVRQANTGRQVAVADTVIPQHAVEPAWLEITTPIEPFFEALEPARADPKTRYGAISVDARPHARVFIDGEDRGLTPVDIRQVPAGIRAVTLIADDYEALTKKVRVLEGEKTPVSAKLKPKTGSLLIKSVPPGAEVKVDGRKRGKTPRKISGLKVGINNVVLRLENHADAVIDIDIEHRMTTKKEIRLIENPGSLFVISEPPGATIYIDGQERGQARPPDYLKIEDVPAGDREVLALIQGRGSWSGTVRVRASQTETVKAVIEDKRGSLILSVNPGAFSLFIDGKPHGDLSAGDSALPDAASGSQLDGLLSRLRSDILGGDKDTHYRIVSLTLQEGKHEVHIQAPGYGSYRKKARIRAGKVKRLKVNFADLAPWQLEAKPRSIGRSFRGKTPSKAWTRGLLFPGAGQYYADSSDHWWLISVLGVGGLTGLGFHFNNKVVEAPGCDPNASIECDPVQRRQTREASICWGIAAVWHLWAAYDGAKQVSNKGWGVSLRATDRDVQVALRRRF